MKAFGWLLVSFLLIATCAGTVLAQSPEGPGFDPTPVDIPVRLDVPARPVTSMDLLTIRDLHGLSISPDGRYVAFVLGQAAFETNSYRSGLFVISTSPGSMPVCLGSAGPPQWDLINQWVEEAPQWSPDSQHIMRRMRRTATENWQVWNWNRAGGQPEEVTHVNGNVRSYEVNPDGTELLLTVEKPRDPLQIRKLTEGGILYDGSFFVDRNQSFVSAALASKPLETELWIHELATGRERPATNEEIQQFGPWESDLDEKVLNKSNPSLEGHHILDAKVSPDRHLVAYRFLPKNPADSRQSIYQLFIKPVRGGTPTQIRMPPDSYVVLNYWWSADSSTLYYTQLGADGRPARLMAVTVKDGVATPVFSKAGYTLSWSVDQHARYMACSQQSPSSPNRVVLIDLANGDVRELIDLNPEFRNIQVSVPIRISGVNKFGDEWFAHVIKPLNYEASKRYPTILTTYRSGDYFLRGASGDENPIQVYAAKGFVVISFDFARDPNLRVRPGNFDDFMEAESSPVSSMEMAIQKGVDMGIVDPAKVGIAGYSRGTEQAAYAITHTRLFRAASGVAGDGSPFYYYMAPDSVKRSFFGWGLGGWPESGAREKWKKLAPDLNADMISIPVLNQDPDSEVIRDLSLYTSLRELKKPVELFIYPNELHHINQPSHRYLIYERNLDWFSFWLKQEERIEPSKTEQYERWRSLRRLMENAAKTADKEADL